MATAENDSIRIPMACPACVAVSGMPYLARTTLHQDGAIAVGMRCGCCGHQWSFHMAVNTPVVGAPILAPKPDRRGHD